MISYDDIKSGRAAVPAEKAPEVRDHDLDLSEIKLDQSAQPRESLNNDRIAEYADAMKAGDQFPPLTVFHDGSTYWLADGFHRHYAAQHVGRKHIRCYVRQGGLRDAILWSVGANAKHGLARSDEDKKRAVMRLLEDAEWSTWTDRDIAKRCHVSHPFVAKIRKAHAGDTGNASSMARTYIHPKTGKPSTMKTAGINASRKISTEQPTAAAKVTTPDANTHGQTGTADTSGLAASVPASRKAEAKEVGQSGQEAAVELPVETGEAASVDLPTNSTPVLGRRDPLDHVLWQVMQLREAWVKASDEARAIFLAEIQFQAKASEDNGATGKATMRRADSMTGEASRVDAGRTASATSERMDATAGETAQISPSAAITADTAPAAPRPNPVGAVPLHSPATLAGADGHPSIPSSDALAAGPGESLNGIAKSEQAVTNFSALSKADQIRLLRPHCQHADDLEKCGGSGAKHCTACRKIAAEANGDAA